MMLYEFLDHFEVVIYHMEQILHRIIDYYDLNNTLCNHYWISFPRFMIQFNIMSWWHGDYVQGKSS